MTPKQTLQLFIAVLFLIGISVTLWITIGITDVTRNDKQTNTTHPITIHTERFYIESSVSHNTFSIERFVDPYDKNTTCYFVSSNLISLTCK